MFDSLEVNSLCNKLEKYIAYLSVKGYKNIDLLKFSTVEN